MEKPTVEQVAWVFTKLCDHLQNGGTFRVLIYRRMGFDESAYQPLFEAGGMTISNAFFELEERRAGRPIDDLLDTVTPGDKP